MSLGGGSAGDGDGCGVFDEEEVAELGRFGGSRGKDFGEVLFLDAVGLGVVHVPEVDDV